MGRKYSSQFTREWIFFLKICNVVALDFIFTYAFIYMKNEKFCSDTHLHTICPV